MVGRLTDDMTRLVGEIHAARDDRDRLMWNLTQAAVETRRSVAHLRRGFADDLAGGRAAWAGARVAVSPQAGGPAAVAPSGRGSDGGRESAPREPEADRSHLETERQASHEARMTRKAGRRHRPR